MKNLSLYISLLVIFSCVLSCQNSDSLESSTEKLEEGYYPKGVIPDWVKETVSEDGYKILQQLSQKYEITFYKLSPQTKANADTLRQKINDETINFLLNYNSNDDDNETPRLKTKSEGNIDYGWTGNPGGTPIGGGYDTGQGLTGGGGGGSKEDDDLEWEAQTHTFWKEYFHLRNLYADVSLGYKYNPKTKKAIEKGNIEISLDKYGLSLSLSWQDRCSAFDIVDEGENLRVLISGRIKSEVAIDGLVGSDLVVESFYKKVEYKVEPGHTDDYLKEDTE